MILDLLIAKILLKGAKMGKLLAIAFPFNTPASNKPICIKRCVTKKNAQDSLSRNDKNALKRGLSFHI